MDVAQTPVGLVFSSTILNFLAHQTVSSTTHLLQDSYPLSYDKW